MMFSRTRLIRTALHDREYFAPIRTNKGEGDNNREEQDRISHDLLISMMSSLL